MGKTEKMSGSPIADNVDMSLGKKNCLFNCQGQNLRGEMTKDQDVKPQGQCGQCTAVTRDYSEAMLRSQSSCRLFWLTPRMHPCNMSDGYALGVVIMEEKMETKAMKREAAGYPNWQLAIFYHTWCDDGKNGRPEALTD